MLGNIAEIALINPAKKRKRKPRTAKQKRRAAARAKRRARVVVKRARPRRARPTRARKRAALPKLRRRRGLTVARKRARARYSKPRKTYKRRRPAVVVVNPVEKDVIQTLKTGGLMAVGGLAAYVLADYMKRSVDFIAENEWAAPAVMIAGGMGIGMVLTGKNRPLATKLGLGMVMIGIITLVGPFLADKLPGLPVAPTEFGPPAPEVPITGYYAPEEMGAYQRIGGYYGEEIPMPSMGQLDPFEETENVYGMSKGYH